MSWDYTTKGRSGLHEKIGDGITCNKPFIRSSYDSPK